MIGTTEIRSIAWVGLIAFIFFIPNHPLAILVFAALTHMSATKNGKIV